MSKYIVKFYKSDKVKYVSHLDIVRMFDRTMRRAGIKIKHSLGFNPHPLMSFAHPLGVGISSMGELAEIELENELSPKELALALDKEFPPGFRVLATKLTYEKSPFSALTFADYTITIKGGFEKNFLDFLENDEIIMPKRTKSGTKDTDIKPFIGSVSVLRHGEKSVELKAVLKCGGENLKPELFIETIAKFTGMEIGDYLICRNELLDDEKQPLIEF